MFILWVVPTMIRFIASQINESTTFEEFVDLTFIHLWQLLEHSLDNIRTSITLDLKARTSSKFVALGADLDPLLTWDRRELTEAVQDGRMAMSSALESLTEWFRRGGVENMEV